MCMLLLTLEFKTMTATQGQRPNRPGPAPYPRAALAALALSLMLTSTGLAAPNSIFDDEWVPPTKRVEPVPVAPVRPESVSPATKPQTPADKPPVIAPPTEVPPPIPAPPPIAAARKPIPDKTSQNASRKLMRAAYAKELADRSVVGREKLVAMLIAEASKFVRQPSDQFVVLVGAVEAAKETGSIRLCVRAADVLSDAFDIDALAVKADAAAKIKLAANSPATLSENMTAGLELLSELTAGEAFADATRLLASLQAASGNNPSYRAVLQSRASDLAYLKLTRERLPQQLQRLRVNPADSEACLAAGRYFCLSRGNWNEGLPLLANGSNPLIKTAATADLRNPATPAAQVAAGDAWWNAAELEAAAVAQAALRQRAVALYKPALASGQIAGLAVTLAEKRIASVAGVQSMAAARPGARLMHTDLFSDAQRAVPKELARNVSAWSPAQFAAYKEVMLSQTKGDKFTAQITFYNAKVKADYVQVGAFIGDSDDLHVAIALHFPKSDAARLARLKEGDKLQAEGTISDFEALTLKRNGKDCLWAKFYCDAATLK